VRRRKAPARGDEDGRNQRDRDRGGGPEQAHRQHLRDEARGQVLPADRELQALAAQRQGAQQGHQPQRRPFAGVGDPQRDAQRRCEDQRLGGEEDADGLGR